MKKQKQTEEGTFKYSQESKDKMKKKKFYITTPIYYINDIPHIGHAYTTVIADILARWHRLKEEDVFLIVGTDENSQKTVQSSIKLGFNTPQKYADYMSEKWKETWKKLNISNDDFIRTTEERHTKLVLDFTEKVNKKKDIYKGTYSGLYCEGCEAFVTESDLNAEGLCPLHLKKPKEIQEENYFFKLSKYQNQLLRAINEKNLVHPESRKNEIINFIKQGLRDISISRQSLVWGIKFPKDEHHRFYVWFDALTNYLHPKDYWPADLQIVGKDIIKFHCIIWPAMLMSAGYKIPKKVFAHGFFTVNGQKMSKSLGNSIDPIELANKYGVDALRYYYAREIPFGNDGDFSEEQLKNRLNNELANELGNLVSRTLTIIEKNLSSEIKKDKSDKELFKNLDIKQIDKFMLDLEPHNAIAAIFHFIHSCNQYVNKKEPWKIKDKKELNKVLYNLTDAIRIISILIQPFLPETSEKIIKQLSLKENEIKLENALPGLLKDIKIKKGEILFKKIEDEGDFQNIKESDNKETILNLKVAIINKVEDHHSADKLYVLQVDLGTEKKQIVSGLKNYYKKEDLIGKSVVVLSNLKPSTLRGIRSDGMLLAADYGEKLVVLEAPKSKAGDQVFIQENIKPNKEEITIDQFLKIKIKIKNKKAICENKILHTIKEDITADIEDGASVK
ncbi:MAG TPA: methionine--tRNA ligase [Candidatus Nanoarchaeia archaeon]|nr:methionine--tRNA ligase [Candidatus Nanoarchaeia archaeon]